MIPIVSGTVRNAVKLSQLDSKWQQKKESGNLFQKDLSPEQKMVNQFQEDMQKMRENNEMAAISSKLKSGNALTPEEIEYLQKNAPELYREYREIQAEKEAYEKQLKNCKTKEEVDTLKVNKMNSILSQAKSVVNNPNIPKGKKLELAEKFLMKVMGIQDIHMKFVKSGQYAKLPTEEEVAEEKEKKAEMSEKVAEALAPEDKKDVGKEEDEKPQEEKIPGDSSKEAVDLPKEPVEDDGAIFAEVRKKLLDFIMDHRPSGYGLEYLADDFPKGHKKLNP